MKTQFRLYCIISALEYMGAMLGHKVNIFICFVFLSTYAYAQNSQISGQAIDAIDQSVLGYTSIELFLSDDSSLVKGLLADSVGQFVFTKLKAGSYYLKSQFLGYEVAYSSELIVDGKNQIQIGELPIQPGIKLLKEIEISGRKSKSFHTIDRQVYDADQFQQVQGGSAVDVIQHLPGVSVDALGEISLRGSSGFVIMIDGRQIQTGASTLLNQLPANSVQNIEILTTPSAKYDPDGKAGIIHINTRKGALDGMYIQINALLGAPSIEAYGNSEPSRRYGADLSINYRKGKWDLAAAIDYRKNDISGQRIGYVNTYLEEVLTEYPSYGERSFDRSQYSGSLTAIYRPKKGQEWSLSFLAGDRTQYRTADILYAPQQRTRIPTERFLGPEAYWNLYQENKGVFSSGEVLNSLTYYNENLRVRQGDFLIGGLDYTWKIDKQNSLTFSGLYERTLLGGPTDNASLAWPTITDTLQYQFNTNDNPLDGVRMKVDYSHTFGALTWESGYQYRYLFHPGDFLYWDRDFVNDRWIENPEFTNRIELKRQIHGLYSQVSCLQQRMQYIVGLRLEYMDRQVDLSKPDSSYLFETLQLFPNLVLQYDLGKDWLLKGGYSRRIERTTTFKMTPFPEREHNETLEQGDAELRPEFIDLLEVVIGKSWGDNSVYMTGYYRGVKDVINRVNSIYNDSILNRIYTNAGNAKAVGVQIGSNLYAAEWLHLYIGGNVYQYRIKGPLFGDNINTANVIYSLNTHADIRFGKGWNLQVGLNYLSQRVTAQGVDSRFYNPGLSLRKSLFAGKMSATLQWQSIDMGLLNSNEQRITTSRDNFFTTTNYVYEVDRVLLSLSFQINQPSKEVKFIKSEFGDKEF